MNKNWQNAVEEFRWIVNKIDFLKDKLTDFENELILLKAAILLLEEKIKQNIKREGEND